MWTFLMVLRGIFAVPALLIGLLLQFLAIVLNLATGIIDLLAVKAASLLASGITLLLLLRSLERKALSPKTGICG